jgi:Fur family transcriptional regulator, peroxide stress response regulator
LEKYEKELQPLREALKASGLRITPQRMAIYLQMLFSEDHPSVSDIHERVRKKLPSISLDTVYRTLWKFSELGLISPVTTSGDGVRFDSRISHHHHFICAKCGRTIDFENSRLDEVPVPAGVERMGEVWDVHMEVRGICKDCL